MKNYVQPGKIIPVIAPADIVSGDGVLIGALFGVASTDAATGADVELAVEGVFELPKEATTDAYNVGDNVKWDAENKRITTSTAAARHGVAVATATATAGTVRVRLSA